MSALMFIDVETTGLDKNKHSIVELAATPVIDGIRHDTLVLKMRPFDGATIDNDALNVHGYSLSEINQWEDQKIQLRKFIEFVDSFDKKFKFAGHNARFDIGFVFSLFCRNSEYSTYVSRFRADTICTYEMAKEIGKKQLGVESLKLGDLCRKFGIKLNKAHNAKDDIEATVELYNALDAMMPKKDSVIDIMTYQEKRRKYLSTEYVSFNPEGDIYISNMATKNKNILMFILSEIWGVHGD